MTIFKFTDLLMHLSTPTIVAFIFVSWLEQIGRQQTKSIPRLELYASHLLAKLSPFLNKLEFENINFWSDSQVTLYW